MTAHVGRLLRGPLHFARNVARGFFRADLRRYLFRLHGHAVRLLIFRLLETAWVLGRVLAVLAGGVLILGGGLLAAVLFYGFMELHQVWYPLEPEERC